MTQEAGGGWHAVVLAAQRGPDDPMAQAFGVAHKCLVEVGGEPMLKRVVRTLLAYEGIASVEVVIDVPQVAAQALGEMAAQVRIAPAAESAAASVFAALQRARQWPVLITTADHALLDAAMLDDMRKAAQGAAADLLVAVARRETVLTRYPQAERTWLKLGRERISGCNLFLFLHPAAVAAVRFWRQLERQRKRPWRIARAFGIVALLRAIFGRGGLDEAFALASQRLGVRVRPVVMAQAEAAIDVDKPQDLALVQDILAARR